MCLLRPSYFLRVLGAYLLWACSMSYPVTASANELGILSVAQRKRQLALRERPAVPVTERRRVGHDRYPRVHELPHSAGEPFNPMHGVIGAATSDIFYGRRILGWRGGKLLIDPLSGWKKMYLPNIQRMHPKCKSNNAWYSFSDSPTHVT